MRLAQAATPFEDAGVVVVLAEHCQMASPARDDQVSARLAQAAVKVVEERQFDPTIDDSVATAGISAPDGHLVAVLTTSLHSETESPARTDQQILTLLADLVGTVEADVWLRLSTAGDGEFALAAAVSAINRASTLDGIHDALSRHGLSATGASGVVLGVVDGSELRPVGERAVELLPILTEAAQTLEPETLPDQESMERWSKGPTSFSSFIAVPVLDSIGGSVAAVGFGFDESRSSREIPSEVRRLMAVTGHAIERVLDHQAASDHASVLETVVFPLALPTSPELDLHARYLPPVEHQRVGGDVYDAWRREDGTTALFVADVAGHDLLATRMAAFLRHAVGILTLAGHDSGEVLVRLNDYLQRSVDPRLATACYCLVDTAAGTVVVSNAGHPQPRIRRRTGEVEMVGPSGETLLGYGSTPYSGVTIPFDEGDALVLFTDGLVEQRGMSLEQGDQRLNTELGFVDEDNSNAIADRLLKSVGEDRDDDVVVLVARRATPALLEMSLRASDLDLSDARTAVTSWFEKLSKPSPDLDPLLLVVDEFLANARDALGANAAESTGESFDTISLQCRSYADHLEVSVANCGDAFVPDLVMPDALSPRGRGLPIAAALADVSLDFEDGQVRVTATLPATR